MGIEASACAQLLLCFAYDAPNLRKMPGCRNQNQMGLFFHTAVLQLSAGISCTVLYNSTVQHIYINIRTYIER